MLFQVGTAVVSLAWSVAHAAVAPSIWRRLLMQELIGALRGLSGKLGIATAVRSAATPATSKPTTSSFFRLTPQKELSACHSSAIGALGRASLIHFGDVEPGNVSYSYQR
jgi:hypothetical protein